MASAPSSTVTVLRVPRLRTDAELVPLQGTFFDLDATYIVLTADTDVLKPDGRYLCRFRKAAIDPALQDLAVTAFRHVASWTSTTRGYAAGTQHRTRTGPRGYERSAPQNSIVAGYMDSPNGTRPCRLTLFSRKHLADYTAALPFIAAMDAHYAALHPTEHALQAAAAATTPAYRIADTAFSTLTVNYNARTALHKDRGDFVQGMGNLVICGGGYRGGQLLFPAFGVAVDVQPGDFLSMDVHEFHCNASLDATDPQRAPDVALDETQESQGMRLAFVAYWREAMARCERTNRMAAWMAESADARLIAGESRVGTEATGRARIVSLLGGDPEEREELGTGPQGHVWYRVRRGDRELIYKNKQYTAVDHSQTPPRIFKGLHAAHEAWMGGSSRTVM